MHFFIREHPAVFFVTAVMSLFSKSNAHCEVAEVLAMPKNTILRLIDVLPTGAGKQAFFDIKSARIARTPCTPPRPRKPNRVLIA